MTGVSQAPSPSRAAPEHGGPSLALASRGDALTPYLFDALGRRFPIAGRIDPELTARQRYQVAAVTFRHSRTKWIERFYKSGHAQRLRSANATRALARLTEPFDLVFQVHALFDIPRARGVLYVDCTHRQSVEGWPAWNPLGPRALQAWYRREREQYQRAEHIFAFFEQTRRSLIDDYDVPPEKVTVTGAGVNLHRLPELAGPSARSAEHRATSPTVLFVGHDFVRKGGRVLLEAFAQVRRALPDARLQLIGSHPQVAPEPGVEVLGRIRDRTRLEELYRAATVFVMPSYFDPFPLVVLEAMAFGLPVVGTRQSGIPDMVRDGETGLTVGVGRPGDTAAALLELLENPERAARFGAAGRKRAEDDFTWDAVVDRMAPALRAASAGARP